MTVNINASAFFTKIYPLADPRAAQLAKGEAEKYMREITKNLARFEEWNCGK